VQTPSTLSISIYPSDSPSLSRSPPLSPCIYAAGDLLADLSLGVDGSRGAEQQQQQQQAAEERPCTDGHICSPEPTSGQAAAEAGKAAAAAASTAPYFQHLVFDCDGVLVDTERASCESLRQAILEVCVYVCVCVCVCVCVSACIGGIVRGSLRVAVDRAGCRFEHPPSPPSPPTAHPISTSHPLSNAPNPDR